jgi:hypothetical protein
MTSADGSPDYPHITAEVIAGLPDRQLAQAVFDHIRDRVGEAYDQLERVLGELPPGFSLVYQLFGLNGEIGNGGFNQYFFNRLDQYAGQQAEALRLIGAAEHLRIFEEAQRLHSAELQNEELQRLYREGTQEAFFATYRLTGLGQCDDAWYALDKQFDSLLAGFITAA